jgi:hypothetical protein
MGPVEGTGSLPRHIGGLVGRNDQGLLTNCSASGSVSGGYQYVGGLVGSSSGGNLTACSAVGSVSGGDHVGGLVGNNSQAPINDSYAAGLVSGDDYVGGLVGYNSNGNLHDCSATGPVEGTGTLPEHIGGLVGRNDKGILTTCSASGSVSGGYQYVGGLVGSCLGGNLLACSATGSAAGGDHVGGLVGNNSQASINDCYASGSVNGDDYIGGLVGDNSNGNLLACSAGGAVLGSGSIPEYVGGLVGYNNQGMLIGCSASGSVGGYRYTGGLVGNNSDGNLTVCSAAGVVTGEDYVGGLVGKNSQGNLNNSYAAGAVGGNEYVGGLVGDNAKNSLSACYSVGRVSGTGYNPRYVGGLVGGSSEGEMLKSCFWDFETSGLTASAVGIPRTTEEMKTRSTFTRAGWDFLDEMENGIAETWTILGGIDYPRLCWEVYYKIAYAPSPPDGAIHLETWAELSWIPSITAGRHDVYFGDNFDDVNNGLSKVSDSNQTEPNFTIGLSDGPYPDGFVPGTTYYWRIDEVNEADPASPWKGDVWSFTVPKRRAHDPKPSDGAIEVDPNVVLAWTPGYGAQSHTIYFGEDFDHVNNAAGGAAQEPNSYVPGTLDSRRTYYWRVDEFDGSETHRGNVWSFTTREWRIGREMQVTASKDDGYAVGGNLQNLEFDFMRVGSSASEQLPYYISGMIFRDVNVPKGARIASARLKIRTHERRLTAEVYGTIQAEDADRAVVFSSSSPIDGRHRTNASVNWDHIEPWLPDTWYESPDIAEVIQEVINRDGWSEGNSLAVFYSAREHKGGYREISSYDRGVDYAPVLVIIYEP